MEYYFRGFGLLVIFLVLLTLVYFNFSKIKSFYVLLKSLRGESDYLKQRRVQVEKVANIDRSFRDKWFKMFLVGVGVSVVEILLSAFVLMNHQDYSLIVLLLFIGCGAFLYYSIKEYIKGFDDNVVKPIISKCSPNLEYTKGENFSVDEYKKLNFLERFNKVKTNNVIYNKNTNLHAYDLEVLNDGSDKEGDYVISTLFKGIIFTLDVKNINSRILIGDVRELFTLNDDSRAMDLHNNDFNALYKLRSNNVEFATKVLSDDVLNCLVNLKKNLKSDIDIRIINDKIYARVTTPYSIKPYLFYDKIEVHNILSYLIVLDEVMKAMYLLKTKVDSNII